MQKIRINVFYIALVFVLGMTGEGGYILYAHNNVSGAANANTDIPAAATTLPAPTSDSFLSASSSAATSSDTTMGDATETPTTALAVPMTATKTPATKVASTATAAKTTTKANANTPPAVVALAHATVMGKPPTAPGGLNALVTDTQVTLLWSPPVKTDGLEGYRVYRNGELVGLTGVTSGIKKYVQMNLLPNTAYTFRVLAYDTVGNLSDSVSINVKTLPTPVANTFYPAGTDIPAMPIFGDGRIGNAAPAPDTTTDSTPPDSTAPATPPATPPPAATATGATADTVAPSIPSGVTATAISSTQIALTWSASTDNVAVSGYKIFRNGTALSTISGVSYTNTGLTPSTAYTYTVLAYDAAGNNSAQSGSANATTPAGTTQSTTYDVSVANLGNPITPSSLTVHVGDRVRFKYVSTKGEAKLRFTPSTISSFTLDHEETSRTVTFSTAGTWTYNGGGPTATIVVQ